MAEHEKPCLLASAKITGEYATFVQGRMRERSLLFLIRSDHVYKFSVEAHEHFGMNKCLCDLPALCLAL